MTDPDRYGFNQSGSDMYGGGTGDGDCGWCDGWGCGRGDAEGGGMGGNLASGHALNDAQPPPEVNP